jgi:hypothetical protein
MKVIAVHAFARARDEHPEAIFTVSARSEEEALRLVAADPAGLFYARLTTETYAEISHYETASIIAFEEVHRR